MRGHENVVKQVGVKLAGMIGAIAMSLVGMAVSGTANAESAAPETGVGTRTLATDGQGRFREAINWVQWGKEEQELTAGKVVWTTPVRVGATHWSATRCSIVSAGGADEALSDTHPMLTYRSGDWPGDGLPYLYNKGGVRSNTMVTGIGNYNDTEKVSFDFSCAAYLINSPTDPTGTLNEGTSTAAYTQVPLQGLIFADAESNNWVRYPDGSYEQEEYIKARPESSIAGQTPTWRLLDSYRTPGCTTNSVAELKDDTMRFRSDGAQCSNMEPYNTYSGPSSVMFLQGSQHARVTLKGGGNTAVALGSIALPDFGDAPLSYGAASSLFQPEWYGGELGADITGTPYTGDPIDPDNTMVGGTLFNLSQAKDDFATNNTKLAGFTEPTPRLGVHEDAEERTIFSDNANGDDLNSTHPISGHGANENDEDGLAAAPHGTSGNVDIIPNGDTFQQTVSCAADGMAQVRGWIDWNRNGVFDERTESSDQVDCTGSSPAPGGGFTQGSATLTWNVPADAVPSVKGKSGLSQSFERLRITNETDPSTGRVISLPATGATTGGEVEDYAVDVHVSTLHVLVNLPGGRQDPTDQFALNAANSSGTSVGSATTSGNANGLQSQQIGPHPYAPGTDYTVSAPLAPGSASGANRYQSSLSCVDLVSHTAVAVDANGKFTMPADANVQCTFVESVRSNPKLTVITHVNGGSALPSDFPVTATSTADGTSTPVPDSSPVALGQGSYKLSTDMSNRPGYKLTSPLSCTVGTPPVAVSMANATVALANGDSVNCEQTVTPRKATLTLKTIVERGDAKPIDFNFTVQLSGGSKPKVYLQGVPHFSAGNIAGIIGSLKNGYVQDGDILYYRNGDMTRRAPLLLSEVREALRDGESVTGVRKVTTHWPKLTVKRVRHYHYGGTPACDGSHVMIGYQGFPGHEAALGRSRYVPSGKHFIAQSINRGYQQESISAQLADGTPVPIGPDGTFDVPKDVDETVTIVDVDEPGTLAWSRLDQYSGALLPGSHWQLHGPKGEVVDVSDCTAEVCTGVDQDPTPGKFKVNGDGWGGWTIAETQAPAGYLPTAPQKLTLDPNDPAGLEAGLHKSTIFENGDPVSCGPGCGSVQLKPPSSGPAAGVPTGGPTGAPANGPATGSPTGGPADGPAKPHGPQGGLHTQHDPADSGNQVTQSGAKPGAASMAQGASGFGASPSAPAKRSGKDSRNARLSQTGSDVVVIAVIALAMLALGLLLSKWTRRASHRRTL
ncbi:CshA/CshB family fibrillar adhesin-related protein [Bifidobacterium sp. ESL0682]|uniref:CshA/CshB family fibrillar adhesin-related protein n=1 Tax=Bifidobacterium sp. ESL0682 TaxID=2983212 RepID=UPI0023F9CA68|nr:CshA/CshB family fibrillar adhesin-related protein [Bifidobacterium sp. ESL0682]WEV41984.1 CshA/CshB family fibrillar adhesin-related protein [Bifidobacterium sp. ESL0682]